MPQPASRGGLPHLALITALPVLICAGLLLVAGPARAGVRVALLPGAQSIEPGAEFDLSMEITESGSAFNAFDAYVGYDPAALTLLSMTPISLQEGAYFTSACANRFHRFRPGAGRDTITDVLLCSGVALTGPGQIYRLRFRASNTAQTTTVRFLPGLQFYNDGLYVNPATSSDAFVGIGTTLAVGGPSTLRPGVGAAPNPSRSGTTVTVEMDRAGEQQLLVLDLQGRAVRRLQSGWFDAGVRHVTWDRRNDSGQVVRPGVYLVILRASDRTLDTRCTLLE